MHFSLFYKKELGKWRQEKVILTNMAQIATAGLVHTKNYGWIDLGHANPESKDPTTGANPIWVSYIKTRSKIYGSGKFYYQLRSRK